ncbi:hypothetical protein [Pseudomonas sp. VI4.1]|uniref:hypothetical protein n=1 Tax=Pseudomonas sp. VI4.1 TaxID=1941346 RepID=UPI0015B70564|nr:hypothetical protein [Pseudomonas sp. VI4.1]
MAALLLNKIQNDPDDLSAVRGLQSFLLRQVITVEHRIKRLKKAKGRMLSLKRRGSTKARSAVLKKFASKVEDRIQDLHQLLFLWKCFGDGIACVYQSPYSLKHLYFDGEYGVKSDPGFMLGKAGFINEYRLLRKALAMNVPAILSDLTNVIRHGDICLMGAADPVPLEVKSSANTNARVRRQQEQLRILHEFFRDDGAANFRGVPNTKRIEVSIPLVSYEEQINECMSEAQVRGTAALSPEPGLTYICGRNDTRWAQSIIDLVMQHQTATTLVVALTPESTWLPCKSFTVSMSPANTVLFMQERFTCLVLIELAVVKQLLDERALEPVIIMDGESAIQIAPRMNKVRGNAETRGVADDWKDRVGIFRISELHFLRTATQFESLRWFADSLAGQVETMRSEEPLEVKDGDPFLLEVPEEWLMATDCLATLPDH